MGQAYIWNGVESCPNLLLTHTTSQIVLFEQLECYHTSVVLCTVRCLHPNGQTGKCCINKTKIDSYKTCF